MITALSELPCYYSTGEEIRWKRSVTFIRYSNLLEPLNGYDRYTSLYLSWKLKLIVHNLLFNYELNIYFSI